MKEFSVLANTMLDGKLFQLFITLSKKKKKKKMHTLILRSKEVWTSFCLRCTNCLSWVPLNITAIFRPLALSSGKMSEVGKLLGH